MSFPAPPKAHLVPIEQLPKKRRPYGSRGARLAVPGRVVTSTGVFSQVIDPLATSLTDAHVVLADDDVGMEAADPDDRVEQEQHGGPSSEAIRRAHKRERQWRKWSEDIVPALLEPYMSLMRETESLRNVENIREKRHCAGGCAERKIEVACIYFNKIENIVLCTCTEVALQLLNRGLFPCAPSLPSLAVDIQMLEFVKELFVNAAPNTTAWCDTLEGFLNARKFKLATRNSLRARFGNAMHWYATLVDTANLKMRDYLDTIRGSILDMSDDDPEVTSDARMHEPLHVPTSPSAMDVDEDAESHGPGAGINGHVDRPSDYLRERCPLCFGGSNWSKPAELVDSIVCLDACFTQKRRKSQGNSWVPPREHPETVFVPLNEALKMEETVENLRPSNPRKAKASTEAPDYEPGLRVPTSVLDACNDSFVAADANRVKASTLFFSDTGLMALLCRHDRVLWLVNMTSAGEKQHYALCLLDKLFQHIPISMRIGVLYDIGCQLHRSCLKHHFLPEFLDRMVFGISVFHAYGHQWPCQVIYHPRKCAGFGLTDGEGCERFWSSIKLLIPSLRVSGYYNRIYTLDTQVKHLDKKSMLDLGAWLKRKWVKTMDRAADAQKTLDDVAANGFTKQYLRQQWHDQVSEQTKPLKKQSPKLADQEIFAILALDKIAEDCKEEITSYQQTLETGDFLKGLTAIDVSSLLEDTRKTLEKTKKSIANKRGRLSVDGRLNLSRLMGNEFLKGRMNALALKQRIRDRLRNRKFELENLERAYRKTVNHLKLEKNAQTQIKRKEPAIQALVRKYNKLCLDLERMIRQRKAPRGAIVPVQIDSDGLYQLDVDDDIWQDIGLTDEHDDSNHIPDWLANENVRNGIKALLEYDRCLEEKSRLLHERLAMQEWFLEEWEVVNAAMACSADDQNICYQLNERLEYLLRLCVKWEPSVRIIPCSLPLSWGPSAEELMQYRQYEYGQQVVAEDEDDPDFNDDDIEDADFLDSVESTVLVEQYRQ